MTPRRSNQNDKLVDKLAKGAAITAVAAGTLKDGANKQLLALQINFLLDSYLSLVGSLRIRDKLSIYNEGR